MEDPIKYDFDKCLNAYIAQQILHLELQIYTFDEIVRWLQHLLKPVTKRDYYCMTELAHLLWYRVGRGETPLSTVPIQQWMLHA